jgi:hypothetical protein
MGACSSSMGFDRTRLTSIAEENTDGAEVPQGCRRCSTTLQTLLGPCQTVLGDAVSRAEESRIDGKDSVQAVLASRDSCRSVPTWCGPKVSRSSGALPDTKIGSGYSELTVGVRKRIAELLVLGA